MTNLLHANIKKEQHNWMVDISGEYVSAIKKFLRNDDIPQEGVNSIISNASRVLGYCPNPKDRSDINVTGLMIGKVQSGKTSSFISLTAAAFDNGYNIVCILGGTKNELLKQNKTRVSEYFEETDAVVLSVVEDEDDMNENAIRNYIELEKKIVIMLLKHQGRIDSLRKNLFSSSYISSQPILIIDDEGDEHTPNTARKKKKESTKYAAIKKLVSTCKRGAFISVTATPQANIIMPIVDVLSPDFAVLINPGIGYCGLDVFHDVDSEYCITVPDEESTILEDSGIPSSFLDALSLFFISSTIYHNRTNKKKKFSMLIHPSRIVNDLSSVREKTHKKIEEWREILKNPDDIAYNDLKSRFKKTYDERMSKSHPLDFDILFKNILYEVRNCGIHLITGSNHLEGRDKNFSNNIYIGGDMVGRGLTFKGLAITYIIRSAKGISNVDTVQQRARWFGYKQEYLDLCKIYATRKILEDFENIKVHEEDLWQTVYEHNLNGRNFKEMKRIFELSEKLRPTRTSVGRTERYQFTLWNIENKFIENQQYQKHNIKIMSSIEQNYNHLHKIEVYGGTKVKVIRNLSFDEIVTTYLRKFHSPIDSKVDSSFLIKLNRMLKNAGVDAKCDLVWPRYDKEYQKINIHLDGTINNFMVGQRPKGVPLEKTIYPGDRYLKRGNVIEIQFHNIMNVKTHETSLSLAVYIPPEYGNHNIIIGE